MPGVETELVFAKLSDVDEALQVERKQEVDRAVVANVRKKVRLADRLKLHTETLPTKDGGVATLITS